MKVIKNYFCFFSRHPFLFNLLGLVLALCAFVFWETKEGHINGWYILLLSLLFLGHFILVRCVSEKYIKVVRNEWFDGLENENEWFRVLVCEDGRKIILTKPVWEKGEVYFVHNPQERCNPRDEFIHRMLMKGKYKNSYFRFIVEIKLKLSGDFDKMEVFNALFSDHLKSGRKGDWLRLEFYVESVFSRFNNPNQSKINELVERYSKQEISEPVLMDSLIETIVFPERLFSNTDDVQICLENWTTSSCKGFACTK